MWTESRRLIFTTAIAVVALLVSYIALIPSVKGKEGESSSPFLEDERNTIEVFKQTGPAVVFVYNIQHTYDMFSRSETDVPAGAGSGFVWDDVGHIITNFHVVQGADSVAVKLQNGETLDAKRVGVEPKKDFAILKVDPAKLPKGTGFFNRTADSRALVVGQKTIAIGNPFGLDQTLTVGVISALGRPILGIGNVTIRDMVQTDASINPGNSGGPLINSRGQLIGMNTQIASSSGSSAGIGFAVPSNTIARLASQIIKYGKVIQPGLGISTISDAMARYYGIEGLVVSGVARGSSAEKAGLRGPSRTRSGRPSFDLITTIAGQKVKNYDDTYNILESKKVGEEVSVTYIRDGKEKTTRIKLIQIDQY